MSNGKALVYKSLYLGLAEQTELEVELRAVWQKDGQGCGSSLEMGSVAGLIWGRVLQDQVCGKCP